jgi:hypothetical protein
MDQASGMFRKSTKTGNVLSAIESQGFRIRRASAPGFLKLLPHPSGDELQCLNDTSSPKSALKRTKGKPESFAVTGKTGKPGVAETDLVSNYAAGSKPPNRSEPGTMIRNPD